MMRLPDDPYFDSNAVEARIQNLWVQYHLALARRDLEPMKPYFSSDLYAREESLLRQDERANRMRDDTRPTVLSTELRYLGTERGEEQLLCSLFTRYTPKTLSWDSRKRLSARGETFFREEWVLSRPVGTKTPVPGKAFNAHCPGCGAPLSLYKSAKCPMCGTLTKVPDFTWTVSKITVRAEPNP